MNILCNFCSTHYPLSPPGHPALGDAPPALPHPRIIRRCVPKSPPKPHLYNLNANNTENNYNSRPSTPQPSEVHTIYKIHLAQVNEVPVAWQLGNPLVEGCFWAVQKQQKPLNALSCFNHKNNNQTKQKSRCEWPSGFYRAVIIIDKQ